MRNSTIITRKKKLSCGHFDYNFSKNRCKQCATIEDTNKRFEKYNSKDISENKEEIWNWFKEKRKEMTGVCSHCGNQSSKKDDDKFHFSIAHILPKAYFPSIATHPDNWVELCFWGNACHSNMDNKMLDLIDMNCFDEIIEKFVKMYPYIAENEKKRIPSILIEYLKNEI